MGNGWRTAAAMTTTRAFYGGLVVFWGGRASQLTTCKTTDEVVFELLVRGVVSR